MHKFIKGLIIVWTVLCFFGLISGCLNAGMIMADKPVSTARSVGSALGLMVGFWFWLMVWGVPTAIMGVLAWAFKPKNIPTVYVAPAPNYYPQQAAIQSPSPPPIPSPNQASNYPAPPVYPKNASPVNVAETLIIILTIIIIAGMLYFRR